MCSVPYFVLLHPCVLLHNMFYSMYSIPCDLFQVIYSMCSIPRVLFHVFYSICSTPCVLFLEFYSMCSIPRVLFHMFYSICSIPWVLFHMFYSIWSVPCVLFHMFYSILWSVPCVLFREFYSMSSTLRLCHTLRDWSEWQVCVAPVPVSDSYLCLYCTLTRCACKSMPVTKHNDQANVWPWPWQWGSNRCLWSIAWATGDKCSEDEPFLCRTIERCSWHSFWTVV